jgi:dipeptidyl aminopeptidase/acylaminoacyl peptidase
MAMAHLYPTFHLTTQGTIMKKTIMLLAALLAFSVTALAQLPPIIDRELFFGDPEISGAQISPNGRFISFLKPFKGVRNIWVKERSEPFEKGRPITADTTRPVMAYFWSIDSKYVLYVQDKGGDENYRIYAVDPTASGDPVPPARDLTPLEKVRAMIYDVPRKTPNEILIGLNDRRADLHDVYRLNLTTGERTLIRKNDENVAGWLDDLDGNLRLGLRVTPSGGTEILKLDKDSLTSIYEVTADESCGPLRFTPDGKKFYLETNKGDALDKIQLQLYDVATGKTTLVDKDPMNQVDFAGALFSDVTNDLLATYYVGDKMRLYPKEKKFAEDYARLRKELPDGEISLGNMTEDENLWVVVVSSDVDPGSRYLFDRRTGKAELLYRARPDLPSKDLAPMEPVSYKARDGLTIPAYLVLPKGIPGKNLPTVMLIHGGPWYRDSWGYNPEAQFLANRGYAVLMPNFRGSTGYGKEFLNAGNKQWGTGYMQHDITDGVKYLIAKGIADPKRVGIYGGSYGGYATLAGLVFTPDLYAAGVDYVGPSNIITLLSTIPPYWAPIKKIFDVRVGDMNSPEDKKRLEEESPLNSAKNIRVPLLVVQGANDPRVKKAESDRIVIAVRDQGKPVEYLVAPDEGHGFAGRDNRMAFYTAQERFLAKYLGGRFQESVTPEVQKKLEALTVDVKTVTMPAMPKAEATPSAMSAFKGSMMKPSTSHYVTKLTMMGRDLSIPSIRSIIEASLEGKKVWRVIEESTGPMGAGADTLDLDGTTLLPIRRGGTEGMATMWFKFSNEAVEGKIVAGPQEMPINVKLSGPVLPEGAGVEIPVGTLPLAEGYTALVEVFNTMQAKTQEMTLKVTGTEKVTVPAGTFETYKVEITPQADEGGGSKLWIAKDDRRIIRVENQLPAQMGGGIAVSELTQ